MKVIVEIPHSFATFIMPLTFLNLASASNENAYSRDLFNTIDLCAILLCNP